MGRYVLVGTTLKYLGKWCRYIPHSSSWLSCSYAGTTLKYPVKCVDTYIPIKYLTGTNDVGALNPAHVGVALVAIPVQ